MENKQIVVQIVLYQIMSPVSEWSDDQSVGVSKVFIAELELGITDVHVTVSGFIIPAMA